MTARKGTLILASILVGWHSLAVYADQTEDGKFIVQSNLRAGVAKVDITPGETDGVMVTGHRRKVFGVRDPLRAGVLVLDDGETKAAIVTLDTIGAWDEMVTLARQRIFICFEPLARRVCLHDFRPRRMHLH